MAGARGRAGLALLLALVGGPPADAGDAWCGWAAPVSVPVYHAAPLPVCVYPIASVTYVLPAVTHPLPPLPPCPPVTAVPRPAPVYATPTPAPPSGPVRAGNGKAEARPGRVEADMPKKIEPVAPKKKETPAAEKEKEPPAAEKEKEPPSPAFPEKGAATGKRAPTIAGSRWTGTAPPDPAANRRRVQVGFWNLTGQDVVVKVNDQERAVPKDRAITLELGREFVWQAGQAPPRAEHVPDGQNAYEVVIRP